MDATTFLDNFATVAEAPGGVRRLRDLVLDLAVSGRLVSMTDGEPSTLPTRGIKASPDAPFDIPESWRWLPLGDVADSRLGKMLDKAKNTGPLRRYLRNANVQWFRFDLNDVHELRLEDRDLAAHNLQIGDLVICEGGEPGRLAICDETVNGMVIQKALHRVRPSSDIDPRYLAYVIQRHARTGLLSTFFTGATIKHLTGKALASVPVPVPPLAEQERIVTKVGVLMELCDELEARQERRHRATTRFRGSALHALTEAETPDDLRSAWGRVNANWPVLTESSDVLSDLRRTILQLAVRGRLVPQLEQENSLAVADLAATAFESTKLWDLPGLSAAPATWSRLPMGSLGRWGSGGTPAKSHSEYYGGDVPWVVIGDLNNAVVMDTANRITAAGLSGSAAKWIPAGSVLIAMYGASIGKTGVAGIDCTSNQAIAHCVPRPSVVTTDYLFVLARTLRPVLAEVGKGAAQPNISQQILKHLVVAVPPLGEQGRIVDRVKQLSELCDSLETFLKTAHDERARASTGLTRIG